MRTVRWQDLTAVATPRTRAVLDELQEELEPAPSQRVRARGGYRDDLGRYFRSAWEANYARYLNWLLRQGVIVEWDYEPKGLEWTFAGIKRGTRSYKPDFVVTFPTGRTEVHEVKGYMDAKSRTKLARMKRYHPDVKVIVIDAASYRSIAEVGRRLPHWE